MHIARFSEKIAFVVLLLKRRYFTQKCEKNPLTRRREIPQCALLVTQRITKYPVMVQAILDNSSKKGNTVGCL